MNKLALYVVIATCLPLSLSQGEYDFGGRSFPFREQYKTFATITDGKLIDYGFYGPLFQNANLPTTEQTTNPNAFALVEYFSNVTTNFRKFHDLLPFEFLHLHYNPKGHPGAPQENAWALSHFDIHLSLEKPEYVRGIDCTSGHGTLCETNPLFYNLPDSVYLPTGSWIAVDPVEQMGIHWYEQSTNYGLNSFSTTPANLYVSFDGNLIIHEPMISVNLVQNITASTIKVRSFSFPRPQRHAKPGLYFDTFEIKADIANNRLSFTCKDLYRAAEWFRDTPVYIGPPYVPPTTTTVSIVSSSKNCFIRSETNGSIDGGYEVTSSGVSYCCLKKMPYRFNSGTSQSECVNSDCIFSVYSGNTFVDPTFSRRCFAQCFERVPI